MVVFYTYISTQILCISVLIYGGMSMDTWTRIHTHGGGVRRRVGVV